MLKQVIKIKKIFFYHIVKMITHHYFITFALNKFKIQSYEKQIFNIYSLRILYQ